MFIAAAASGRAPTPLAMVAVLSYFFLIEIFHPELENKDQEELPEAHTV
jgi:hypothetical protein